MTSTPALVLSLPEHLIPFSKIYSVISAIISSRSFTARQPRNIRYGLVAEARTNTCTNSYWDGDVNTPSTQPNPQACPSGRKTTPQMQTQSTYVAWDFANIWAMLPNSYPILRKP